MGQKQHDQSEEHAAGVETPSQQNSRDEDGVIVEVNGGRGDGQKSARQQYHCGEQQYASRHEQGFQRGFAPQIQAGLIL